ncbi:MAG: glycerophosphodiester phosphodiesterase [Pseudomonadota bacterium]
MRMRPTILVVALLVAGCGDPAPLKPYLTRFDRPLHISHQGGADVFPSNTLLAYEYARYLYDTDVLEIDVHRTADGVLVVLHDDTVDRTTDGSGRVRDMDLDVLRSLDAGYRFSTDDGQSFPYRGQGLVIPTLSEIFQAFPDVLTNIEIKQLDPPIEEDLVRLIREFRVVGTVCLGSFDDASAEHLRDLLPEACHYAPEDMATQFYASTRVSLGGVFPLPVDALALPTTSAGLDVLDPGLLNAAHDRGVHVWAWTINTRDEMKRLLDLGIDGIMTDRPDLLDEEMSEQGLR